MRSRRLIRPRTHGRAQLRRREPDDSRRRWHLPTLAMHRSGGPPSAPVLHAIRSVASTPLHVVHCQEMTVNPTFLARSIRPTAAASSSAFAVISGRLTVRRHVAVAEDDVHQPVPGTAESKFNVQRYSSDRDDHRQRTQARPSATSPDVGDFAVAGPHHVHPGRRSLTVFWVKAGHDDPAGPGSTPRTITSVLRRGPPSPRPAPPT